jgi:hypothetical protein
MSISTDTTVRPIASAASSVEAAGNETRGAEYRARVDILRRSYKRRACRNGVFANGVSLALIATGAALSLTPMVEAYKNYAAYLGVAVILLEGVTRVLRPALRATRARKVARRLDREFRLYDACGRGYRCGGSEADAAFVTAVERILEQADAAEEHDESGPPEPTAPRKAS